MKCLLVIVALVQLGQSELFLKNCTDSTGMLAATAINCKNKMGDTYCDKVYVPAAPLVVGTDADRAAVCYTGEDAGTADNINPTFVNAAKQCAKTCGLCCITPEYDCPNAPIPKLNCASITDSMCDIPSWRAQIATECPSRCGLCLEGGCVDLVVDCKTQFPAICHDASLTAFVQENCKRTCGLCNNAAVTVPAATTRAPSAPAATTRSPSTGVCLDSQKNCPSWVANGYCTNPFYTDADRRPVCGKSCRLC